MHYAVQQLFLYVAQVLGKQCHSIMTKVNALLIQTFSVLGMVTIKN